MNESSTPHKLLRLRTVLEARAGRSKSGHYADIRQGLWTKPVAVGQKAVAWPADEVAALNAAVISGKTPDEVRALVVKLEKRRKSLAA